MYSFTENNLYHVNSLRVLYVYIHYAILSTHFILLIHPSHTAEYCVHGVYYGHCTHTFIPTTPFSARSVLSIGYFLQQQS